MQNANLETSRTESGGCPVSAEALSRAAQDAVAMHCSGLSSYDPLAPEELSHPEASWTLAIESGAPVQYVESLGMWMVFSFDVLEELLRDTETFSSVGAYAHLPAVPDELRDRLRHGWPHFGTARSLITTDPPEHTPVRKLANKALSPRAVVALEPRARQAAVATLRRVYDEGRGDLLGDFIKPYPIQVFADLLGVHDPAIRERFPLWSEAALHIANPALTPEEVLTWGTLLAELNEYLDELVERRRLEPEDDLLTRLAEGHQDGVLLLTTPQIISVATQMIVAGADSTATLISNTLYLTQTRYPAEWERMTSDPAAIPLVLEEMLRIKSPFRGFMRRAAKDAQLGGVRIPAGAHIMCVNAAAGHDPGQFEEPAKFDHERPNLNRHLSFGRGTHFCIGAALARMQARVALEEIIRRMPDIRLQEGAAPNWNPFLYTQSLDSLPMEWTPQSQFAAAAGTPE